MRSAYLNERAVDGRARLRRRVSGTLLALLIEALVITIVILTLVPVRFAGTDQGSLTTFNVAPPSASKDKTHSQNQNRPQPRRSADKPPPPQAQQVPPVAPPVPLSNIPGMLTLRREDYAATDIGKIKSAPAQLADAGDGADDSAAIGNAPNGEPLYQAEWYREPTEAEMAFYIPKNLRYGATGLIACRTAPNYRVEGCVVLGDNPPGTGLARGVREAAWQFRVRPPRKGGKPMIGAWVRIQFNIVDRKGG